MNVKPLPLVISSYSPNPPKTGSVGSLHYVGNGQLLVYQNNSVSWVKINTIVFQPDILKCFLKSRNQQLISKTEITKNKLITFRKSIFDFVLK